MQNASDRILKNFSAVTPEIIYRFNSYVKKPTTEDGCWIWTGNILKSGYGRFGVERAGIRAHRFAYRLWVGEIPESKPFILHDCPDRDNRACVNPEHLWAGTHEDNMRDMIEKGTQATGDRVCMRKYPYKRPFGERNGSKTKPESVLKGEQIALSVLTENSVREIRRSYVKGKVSLEQLAALYGVSFSAVSRVIRRQTWKHV